MCKAPELLGLFLFNLLHSNTLANILTKKFNPLIYLVFSIHKANNSGKAYTHKADIKQKQVWPLQVKIRVNWSNLEFKIENSVQLATMNEHQIIINANFLSV
jgi:pyoverdine/dityrosine biosynthesis protein Dit1